MNILKKESLFSHKIKKSEFIVSLQYCTSIDEAKTFIKQVSKKHPQANHNCWAYVVGEKQIISHSSDNGEPPGTAGKPMLNALLKAELTNIACVVTRYFGGIKLGVRGLIDAYFESVALAIENSEIEKLVKYKTCNIACDYSFFDTLKHKLTNLNADFTNVSYGAEIEIELKYEEQYAESIDEFLSQLVNSGKIKKI